MSSSSGTVVSRAAVAAAWLSIVAGAVFAMLLASLHVLEPEFDPRWRFISEYALGRFGWMMVAAFAALAFSVGGAAAALYSQVRTAAGYIGLALLGLAALGMGIAAIFVTDPATAGADAATFSGTMHVIGASLDHTPIAVLLLSLSVTRDERWQPVRTRLLTAAAVTLIALTAFMFTLPFDGRVGPEVHAGLFGRILLVSYLGWLMPAAYHVIQLRRMETVRSV